MVDVEVVLKTKSMSCRVGLLEGRQDCTGTQIIKGIKCGESHIQKSMCVWVDVVIPLESCLD